MFHSTAFIVWLFLSDRFFLFIFNQSSEDTITSPLEKLASVVDSLSSTRPATRVAIILSLQKAFRMKYYGFPGLNERWQYYETLISCLDTSLRRGKPCEQVAAAQCLGILIAQLTPFDNRALLEQFQTYLETRVCDHTEKSAFRGVCATTLSWLHYLSDQRDFTAIKKLMTSLEGVFKASCLKGDGRPPTLQPAEVALHCECLRAWCLLYTLLPSYDASTVGQDLLKSLVSLLQSNQLDVRLAAGDAIGVIYERIRNENESFKGAYFAGIIDVLNQLTNSSDKSTSKVDSKRQRSSFRDLLAFLNSHSLPFEQTIKLRTERLVMDSLCQIFLYESFCRLIAVGMETHLRENEQLREIFDLGPPPSQEHSSQSTRVGNKKARQYANQQASKIRTQHRKKSRDKRTALSVEEC